MTLKVIIDFDGTLTAEEEQSSLLAEKSMATLAHEIINAPLPQITADYQATFARVQRQPHLYRWEVNGLIASYGDEGAFILNTTTIQTMLRENDAYTRAVQAAFPHPEYDAVVDCSNYLFHRHTAELPIIFRPVAADVLAELIAQPQRLPIVLTNSLDDKVRRHLSHLGLDGEPAVLGDTRQYDMDPTWEQTFPHPALGDIQIWPAAADYPIDLRRPAYYQALVQAAADGSQLAVVADTLSLPGALPLMMGIPFFLLRTTYTPDWCLQAVKAHPLGFVLDALADLSQALPS